MFKQGGEVSAKILHHCISKSGHCLTKHLTLENGHVFASKNKNSLCFKSTRMTSYVM